MKSGFLNQVVVITGAARGIGKNIARSFGKSGAQVIICDIDKKRAKKTLSEFLSQDIKTAYIPLNLSLKRNPQALIKKTVQKYKKINVLINNAVVKTKTTMLTESESSWKQSMDVNLKAAFFTSQAAINAMRISGGGNIINISSVAAQYVGNEPPTYHIAKAGLVQMTKYLAVHAGKYNIRINAVLPGHIIQDEHTARYQKKENLRYRQTTQFSHPLGRPGQSSDVVQAVLFLCSKRAKFITGQALVVDGGLTIQDQSALLHNFAKQ